MKLLGFLFEVIRVKIYLKVTKLHFFKLRTLRNHKKAKNVPIGGKNFQKNMVPVEDSSDEVKVISVHPPAASVTSTTKSASSHLAHQSSTKAQLAQRLEAKAALMASQQHQQQQHHQQQVQPAVLDEAAQLWLYGKPGDGLPGFDQHQALPVETSQFQAGDFYCHQQPQSYHLAMPDSGPGLTHGCGERLVSLQPHQQQQQIFTLDGLAMYQHQQQSMGDAVPQTYQVVHSHQAYHQHPTMAFSYGDVQQAATNAVEVSQLTGFFDDVFV